MVRYELTVVVSPDEAGDKAVVEIENSLKKLKVKVVGRDDWGTKQLAYLIKKHDEARIIYYVIEAEPKASLLLRDRLRIEHGVLRWLLVIAAAEGLEAKAE